MSVVPVPRLRNHSLWLLWFHYWNNTLLSILPGTQMPLYIKRFLCSGHGEGELFQILWDIQELFSLLLSGGLREFLYTHANQFTDEMQIDPSSISRTLSLWCFCLSVLCPVHSSYLASLHSQLHFLNTGCLSGSVRISFSMLWPGNSLWAVSWVNCRAHFISASLLLGITVLHCLLSNGWKPFFHVFCLISQVTFKLGKI